MSRTGPSDETPRSPTRSLRIPLEPIGHQPRRLPRGRVGGRGGREAPHGGGRGGRGSDGYDLPPRDRAPTAPSPWSGPQRHGAVRHEPRLSQPGPPPAVRRGRRRRVLREPVLDRHLVLGDEPLRSRAEHSATLRRALGHQRYVERRSSQVEMPVRVVPVPMERPTGPFNRGPSSASRTASPSSSSSTSGASSARTPRRSSRRSHGRSRQARGRCSLSRASTVTRSDGSSTR